MPSKTKLNFYKNLFFVNGYLASMNAKGLLKCDAGSGIAAGIFGKKPPESGEKWQTTHKNHDCSCNEYGRLGCKAKKDFICDSFTCAGWCGKNEKEKYSFSENTYTPA